MSIIEKDCIELIDKIDLSKLENKKVLVTGASGLIGVYLISILKLQKKKHNIEVYAWCKNDIDKNFVDIFTDCVVIKKDICDEDSFIDLPVFDFIIHAAGYGQPGKFMDDRVKTLKLNTSSTINLFEKLSPNGTFLFLSTSELYSGLDFEEITEEQIGTTNTDHFRSCYIEGKRCGEAICYAYKNKGYNVKIARLSLAYGPGTKKNDHRVLNNIIQKGIQNSVISLLDTGSAIRTYCYITDAIEMFFNIMLHSKETVYNVGGISRVSILELAEEIGNKLGKPVSTPDKTEEVLGNPKVVNMSIDKYCKEFNKNTFISLDRGITNTIEWQIKIYENEQ